MYTAPVVPEPSTTPVYSHDMPSELSAVIGGPSAKLCSAMYAAEVAEEAVEALEYAAAGGGADCCGGIVLLERAWTFGGIYGGETDMLDEGVARFVVCVWWFALVWFA